jgi:amidase
MGHHVEEAAPDVDGQALAKSYLAMYFGEVAADIQALSGILGRKAKPGDVETLTWTLGLLGRTFSSGDMVGAMRQWDLAARRMGRFFETYDLYLTPTTAYPPARIGELKPSASENLMMKLVNTLNLGGLLKASGIVDQMAIKSLERTPFTQVANLCGLPAMSVPLYWSGEGLPLGSQFIARFGNETLLFKLAAQLEKARPWFDKRPPAKRP